MPLSQLLKEYFINTFSVEQSEQITYGLYMAFFSFVDQAMGCVLRNLSKVQIKSEEKLDRTIKLITLVSAHSVAIFLA